MFEAEREGLLALASEGGPRVPVPVVVGADDHSAFFCDGVRCLCDAWPTHSDLIWRTACGLA